MVNHEESNETKIGGKDAALGAACFLDKRAPMAPQEISRQRGDKIQEHLRAVLESGQTLQACMGPVLCDTLEMCQMLKAALAEKIGRVPSPMAGVEKSMPLIQVYLQTIRQAERLANLDCRIRESRSSRLDE
jgi:hypothetical protein